MAFVSEAQKRWFFANMPRDSGANIFDSSSRAHAFQNRINENEKSIYDRDTFQRDVMRERRDHHIESDAKLTDQEKRKLLSYSGAFRGK